MTENALSILIVIFPHNTNKPRPQTESCVFSNLAATFTLHIRNIVKKARDKMGWVLRVFQLWEHSLMLTLLKFLVIPLLEDCCQLWNPFKAKDVKAIEAIQLLFTFEITEVQHLNY